MNKKLSGTRQEEKSSVAAKKKSQVINRNLVTRIYRWTAILGRECVIVGNGDKGFQSRRLG